MNAIAEQSGEGSRRARPRTSRRHYAQVTLHLTIIILVLLTLFPFVMMLSIAGKDNSQFAHESLLPTLPYHLGNYARAFKELIPYFFNTVLVALATTAGILLLSSLSAYAFARHRFPGRDALFLAILSLMMVPGVLTLIPSFVLVKNLRLLNTRWVLIIPSIAGGQVFAIFLLRSFFVSLPEELFEAARLEGANELRIYWHIVLPLSVPILSTIAILHVLGVWNDFIWPLLTVRKQQFLTISVALAYMKPSVEFQQAGMMGIQMAGYTLGALPLFVLFLVTMRTFISGLTTGAIKV